MNEYAKLRNIDRGAKDKSRKQMSYSSLQLFNIASLSYRNKFLKKYDKKKQLEKLILNL